MINKGLFAVFEGPDACGKSTVIENLKKKIISHFNNDEIVVTTREPGGTEVGEKIRNILVSYDVDPRTEALLLAASRNENTWKNIMKNKLENKIILCDRYLHSSLVYQGIVKNLGLKNVLRINEFGIGKLRPDLLFYFDINASESKKRKLNDSKRDKFDRLDNEFTKDDNIKKIISGYFTILKFDNKTIIRVDASKTIDEIVEKIFGYIVKKVKW